MQFAYDAANRRTTLTLANGITVTYGYDNASEVTAITYRDSSSNLLGDLTYAYDNAGRRTAMGGSFARANLPAAIASANYDANTHLTAWGGASLSHDPNGNLLGFQGDTYAWNSRDQLSGITGTNTASFRYDGVGRRLAKTVAGVGSQFLYDGVNPVQELSGATVTANVLTGLGIDEYFARTEGTNTQHYLTDALGSTARLTDGSAVKLVDYTYEPYGNTSADAGSTNSFQYTGRENDGTGLNYYRARYQHPLLGRFISEDPVALTGGPNPYLYASASPALLIDPYGLWTWSGAAVGAFSGGLEGAVTGGITGAIVTSVGGPAAAGGALTGAVVGGIAGAIGGAVTGGLGSPGNSAEGAIYGGIGGVIGGIGGGMPGMVGGIRGGMISGAIGSNSPATGAVAGTIGGALAGGVTGAVQGAGARGTLAGAVVGAVGGLIGGAVAGMASATAVQKCALGTI